MDRQQILDLYYWSPGVCFRHPGEGEQLTTVVKTIHPRDGGDLDVRACAECVIAIEDARRETASREGAKYVPGHAGGVTG